MISKPEHHILVCASFRVNGDPKGACHKKGACGLLEFLEGEILDRGINAQVTSTGCFKVCEQGPVMVVHPGNHWYGKMDEKRIEAVLDHLEDGEPATELLME